MRVNDCITGYEHLGCSPLINQKTGRCYLVSGFLRCLAEQTLLTGYDYGLWFSLGCGSTRNVVLLGMIPLGTWFHPGLAPLGVWFHQVVGSTRGMFPLGVVGSTWGMVPLGVWFHQRHSSIRSVVPLGLWFH